MADERFRRPADHEKLLQDLSSKDGPFSAMYEAMMFAAALGKQKRKREEFKNTGEPIDLARVERRDFGEALIDMLAVVERPDDATILSDDCIRERIRIFEEYANGGLNYLQGELNASGRRDLTTLVSGLVMEALTATAAEEKKDIVTDLLGEGALDW
ncbi:DNA phosphorothioation-associated protein 4 [Streptomyces kaniharaensis]|uniref:DNA phosphorothioation-associated protein 4 n=1 Tax=Streptomyces kaniharaensis TaxID=212423 RepID=A0A6N7KT94_9ACTN|nr:DNA phosphorothioation-associated protein 4 [Streptomyces kaniharaensis]MQS14750.1 DNA phosphorothioation-associated protein 4 [Streptomyces kaniharaensis]